MVVVLLLPVVLIAVACLLDLLERRVVADPPAARTPVARPAGAPAATPVAPVVELHRGAGPAAGSGTRPLAS